MTCPFCKKVIPENYDKKTCPKCYAELPAEEAEEGKTKSGRKEEK